MGQKPYASEHFSLSWFLLRCTEAGGAEEQGAGRGHTLSPPVLQQLLFSKLHPTTLELRGDTHGRVCPQVLTGESVAPSFEQGKKGPEIQLR